MSKKLTKYLPLIGIAGAGAGLLALTLLTRPAVASAPPDYEIKSHFNEGQIMPFNTTYWVGTSGGEMDWQAVRGCHKLVEDEGQTVLKLHSDNLYEVGFGDGLWGRCHPPGSPDYNNKICGQPPDYFGWQPGQPCVVPPSYVPAYWSFEFEVEIKLLKPDIQFGIDNWTYFGPSEVTDPVTNKPYGNSIGLLNVYSKNVGYGPALVYNWGNFPNAPYFALMKQNPTFPQGYFKVRARIDSWPNMTGLATVDWPSYKGTLPIVRERVGYDPSWPYFWQCEIKVLEPGDILVKNARVRLWHKILGGPPENMPPWPQG